MFNLAVVGATGLVGRKILQVLDERKIPFDNLFLFASSKSDGKILSVGNKQYAVQTLSEQNICEKKIDYAIFSAGSDVSEKFAPVFCSGGATVIDNSSFWRRNEKVPLVVPEVNPSDAFAHVGIVANPNCSTIQAAVALSQLHRKFGIKRVVISTYQAVSGAGQAGIADLVNGQNGLPSQKFPVSIYSNVIPFIDGFAENGYTREEDKLTFEMKKILGSDKIRITATAARVPVFYGHSESINVEFCSRISMDEVKKTLKNAENVVLFDDNSYPTAHDVKDSDKIFVGRLRKDDSAKNAINMWVVADNVRKGAATNAVQILELLTKKI